MPTMQNAHGLIVGIANYQHLRRLPATVLADARDVHALLVNPEVCGYPPDNVTLLVDEQATLASLRQALARLADRADPAAAAFIYISSHGGRIETGPGAGEYLLPVDTRIDWSINPPQVDAATAISGAQFTAAVRAIPARKVVVVFDCCHSGGIGTVKSAAEPDFKPGLSESYYNHLAAGRGRVILASSRETEFSWVLPGDGNSLFTKYLKAGLEGGAPGKDGLIHIFELFEYIHPKVTEARPDQHPVLQVRMEENFPIALHRGGLRVTTSTPLVEPITADEFRYDAYISWVRSVEDTVWLREKLLPPLQAAGLRLAMTGRVDEPGVPAVVGIQRAVELSKRTILVLSRAYLASGWAALENITAAHLSIEERRARLLPVVIDDSLLDWERHLTKDAPLSLRQLMPLDVVDEFFGKENLARLPEIIQLPIPATR